MRDAKVSTTCPYCGVGCGLVVETVDDGRIDVRGDPDHPANLGRVCSKGAALAETLGLEGRLLHPYVEGQRIDWNTVLETVAGRFKETIAKYGPDALAFYVSGQLLSEDYYVANKLMKGFVGSGNIDSNSRLCMSSAVAGQTRAFGGDIVPCDYRDLELADLIVLVGSNTAWCHPVLYQRIAQEKARREDLKIVLIDPRRTATCDIADLHLAIAPGCDALLFNALLDYLRRENALDWRFLERHSEGFAESFAAAHASANDIPAVASHCGLHPEQVGRFFRLFAKTKKTVTLYSQGINQSSSGTDKVNSIINCHLATGRIGKLGQGPFSITGQPNAMGGREVGGLANTLAAHMDFEDRAIDRVARLWDTKSIARRPGLKVVDLFQAIAKGKVKAVWIMATNPVVSLPDADSVKAALRRCDFVVVSDSVRHTDTTALAHVLLPASTWGEKDGTVTNSERRISRQRAFLRSPAEVRPDWWIISRVARQMGYGAHFDYRSPADIFREHARLSGFENHGERGFDISALADISDRDYERLEPVQWPLAPDAGSGKGSRPFSDGRFYTGNARARLIAICPEPPVNAPDECFPLVLNTGRVRDQWHTMTRTGKTGRLTAHMPEPLVQVNPKDAGRIGIREGELTCVHSRWGEVIVRAAVTADQRPGSVFVPMHWGALLASSARIGAVVNPAVDPISGEPEFKHTPVRLSPYTPAWHGFALSRRRLGITKAAEYWVISRGKEYWRHELAGECRIKSWSEFARRLLGKEHEWMEFEDPAAGRYRAAIIEADRLEACLFVSRSVSLPPRSWLGELFCADRLGEAHRLSLLAGRPQRVGMDGGETVCSCFGVGRNTILHALRDRRINSVESLGQSLQAGTNCGSCIPELRTLLASIEVQ